MAKAETSAILTSANATRTGGRLGLGSTKWKSPELFKYPPPKFDQACDVYSFGVLVWEVLTGLIPFDGVPNEALSAMVRYEKQRPEPMPTGEEGLGLVQLMQMCWEQEAEVRPMFSAILEDLAPLQETRVGSVDDEEELRSRLSRAESLQRKQNAFEQEKAAFEEEKRLMKAQLAEQARREIEEEKRKLNEGVEEVRTEEVGGRVVRSFGFGEEFV